MSVVGVFGGVFSLITTYMMNIKNGQLIPMSLAVGILIILIYLANARHMLNLAAVMLCTLMGLFLLPSMFLSGGGIYSGMPLWFLLVIVFESILIEGKLKYFICSLSLILYSGLIYFAYVHPEFLTYFENDAMVFMDVGQSLVFVGVCVVSIISFELYMYSIALKKAETAAKEAERAKEDAQRANAAKSVFLASMSHEIRTPMGVILSMNEMIQRESNQESVLDYSKDVSASATSLLSIINDILDFSKIESGKMNIIENEYDLRAILDDIADIARVKKEETGLNFEMKVDPNLPRKVFGDDLRIKQCLLNLISNAFKYTQRGQVIFEVNGVKNNENVQISFAVTDTGIGIKPEERDKLFSSFERLDETKNKNIQGTGLGLNITNRLLNLMGSKLEVDSTYGKGSCFHFTVSQKIIDDTLIFETHKDREDKKTISSTFKAPGANVLVVDDSKLNIKVFCSLLKNSEMNIDTALSGSEAVGAVRDKKYDIIFLDHMMPEMDGEETLDKLKEENILNETPVIMLTANALVGMKEHFIEAGFTDYLSKPIEYKLLEEMLIKYLNK